MERESCRVYVMAFDARAVRFWQLHKAKISRVQGVYLHSEKQLLGIENPQIIRLPGWEGNPIYTPGFLSMIQSRMR